MARAHIPAVGVHGKLYQTVNCSSRTLKASFSFMFIHFLSIG